MQADKLLEALPDIVLTGRTTTVGFPDFRVDERLDRAFFDQAYQQWLQDSAFDSLPDQMKAHESYQAIVALGDRAIPVIAAELRKSPGFLFIALEDITGEDPVPEEAQGNLRATIDAWLTWLRR
jgi:hypothetical protein